MPKDLRDEILAAAEQDSKPKGDTGPQVRVLVCYECKTQEQIPDYPPSANPDNDFTLHYVDEKHGGHTQQAHHRVLHRVSEAVWKDPRARKGILERTWDGKTGFTPQYYDIKDTLQEDAVKCHIAHQRQVPCIDWKDSSKRLKSPTAGDRQKLARDLPRSFKGDRDAIAKGAPVQYLCEFCPVAAAVEHAKQKARGET